MLLRYANLAKEDITSREFVFTSLEFNRMKGNFLQPATKLSCTRARKVILLKLKAIGLDNSKLGLHSRLEAVVLSLPSTMICLIGWLRSTVDDRQIRPKICIVARTLTIA